MKKSLHAVIIALSLFTISCQKDQLSELQTGDSKFRRGDVGGSSEGKCNDIIGNPFAPALDFGAFIEGTMTVYGKEQKTNFAVGGDFIMANGGSYNAGSNGVGTYVVPGELYPTSVWIGGRLVGGNASTNFLKVQGHAYLKVKNWKGYTAVTAGTALELWNKSINQKAATTGLKQDPAQLSNMGPLNMRDAFAKLRQFNKCLSQRIPNVTMNADGLIDCSANPVNYITLTLEQLNSDIKITSNADANHILVINVNGRGQAFHMNGGLTTHAVHGYTMLNFINMPSIHFDRLGSNLQFSILAPDTDAYLDSKEMRGQIVFRNLWQTDKHYMHPYNFKGAL